MALTTPRPAGTPLVRRVRKAPRASTVSLWVFAIAASAIALFPFIWMLRTSITPETFTDGIALIPSTIDFDAYRRVWVDGGMGQAVLVGALVSLSILVVQLVTSVPAAYAFAKLQFRGRDALFGVTLLALLVPGQAIAVPLFLGMSYTDLSNTFAALVLPSTTTAFGLFLLRQYLLSIPDALIDAARMDGLNHVQIMLRVIVPLARPALVTFALFSVFSSWNEYLWPLLVARDPDLRTPPLALAVFQNADTGVDYAALAAGATIITLPIIILFLIARRNFVAGVTGNEVVG